MDRRRSHRYDIKTPVKFSWKGSDGLRHRGSGMSRDLSGMGIFVLSDLCPEIGSIVRFEARLPSVSAEWVQMQAQGQVVRVETIETSRAKGGFAIVTRTFRFFDHDLDESKLRGNESGGEN